MPGTRTASLHGAQISVSTSTDVPGGTDSRSGSPSTVAVPSRRRSALRFQRRAERIVRLAEEQSDELSPARRSIGAQQIGEQTPDLVSPRMRHDLPVAADPRLAEEVDLEC
jgi:hypothetical protein